MSSLRPLPIMHASSTCITFDIPGSIQQCHHNTTFLLYLRGMHKMSVVSDTTIISTQFQSASIEFASSKSMKPATTSMPTDPSISYVQAVKPYSTSPLILTIIRAKVNSYHHSCTLGVRTQGNSLILIRYIRST